LGAWYACGEVSGGAWWRLWRTARVKVVPEDEFEYEAVIMLGKEQDEGRGEGALLTLDKLADKTTQGGISYGLDPAGSRSAACVRACISLG